jgi:hypothetical protein
MAVPEHNSESSARPTSLEADRSRQRAACERAAAAWDRVAVAHERGAWVMHRLHDFEKRDELLEAMKQDRSRSLMLRRRAATHDFD